MDDTSHVKLLRLRDRSEAQRLLGRLTAFTTHGFYEHSEILDAEFTRVFTSFTRTESVPQWTLPGGADDAELDAWFTEITKTVGIGRRFFVGTNLQTLPWLDCEIVSTDWVGNLRGAIGEDISMLSFDRSTLLVMFSEEHLYEAFVATK
jgi:hypothetical protein